MIAVGDVHIFVTDFNLAMRFWAEGLRFEVVEQESSSTAAFAVLESPDGGPAVRLFSGAAPWSDGQRPEVGEHPTIRFDIMTDAFDDALVRLLEHGGEKVSDIEDFDGLRAVTISDPDGNTFELLELDAEQVGDEA